MRSDILNFFEFVNHEELRQDSQSLKPDTKRPGKVQWIKRLMNNSRQYERHPIQIVMWKSIRLLIITQIKRLPLSHQIHRIGSKSNKHDFHYKQVEASPDEDQINIPSNENHKEQLLCLV